MYSITVNSMSPIMRRYEDMVRSQRTKPPLSKKELTKDSRIVYEAPIIKDFQFQGLKFDLAPAPDYIPITEQEIIINRDSNCTRTLVPTERFYWKMDDVRRHGTFLACHEVVYFPMIYGRPKFHSEFARYLWTIRSCRTQFDKNYIRQLKQTLMAAAHRFLALQRKVTINRLVLNDSIYLLSWFSAHTRHTVIRILAETLRDQDEVTWISAENAQLSLDAGIRLLLAISVTAGLSLTSLHLWYYFKGGLLPIVRDNLEEEIIQERLFFPKKIEIGERTIKYFYETFVMHANFTIPPVIKPLALHTALSCLEFLTELSVEYRYLAGGRGESLLYLGCIKNGRLRRLNILFTEYDFFQKTKAQICPLAWKKAYKSCPHFRVNFVAARIPDFDCLVDILVQFMPLEGFYASTSLKCNAMPFYFGFLVTMLTKHYRRFVKRLNIHLVRPPTRMDFILSKLLMELPLLEEYVYRGPIDNIETIYTILRFIENYDLRLKKFYLYLIEDPCQAEPYIKTMNKLKNEYEPMFINKQIDFNLSTCQY